MTKQVMATKSEQRISKSGLIEVATLRIYNAGGLSLPSRRKLAEWLSQRADDIIEIKNYAPAFTARFFHAPKKARKPTPKTLKKPRRR
jgi:hypothetical protein